MSPEQFERMKAEKSVFLSRFAELAPQLQEALALGGDTHTIDDVLQALVENKAMAWLGERCICITTIEVHPRKRVLRYWLVAGDMEELLTMRPGVEAYGRGMNCDQVIESGRDGWARVLKDQGYQKACVVVAKELG